MYIILLGFFSTVSFYALNFGHSKSAYLFILRIYISIEYSILVIFFSRLLQNKLLKKIILYSIIPFLVYCVYNIFVSKPDTFNNYPALLEFSIFILIIVFYFYEKMNVVSSIPLLRSISFWICIGLFIYFTGNLFFFLLITSASDKEINQMFLIYSGVTITKNLILAAAWFANERIQTDADIIQIPENMNLDDDDFTFIKNTNP